MVDEEGEDEVVFPWPGQALYCLAQSLCSRLLSHYFMTSLTLFSLSRPPIALALTLALVLTSASSTSSLPPPPDIIFSIEHSPPLFLLRAAHT